MTNLPPEDEQKKISIRKHSYSYMPHQSAHASKITQVGRDYRESITISFGLVLLLTILPLVIAGTIWFRSQKVAPFDPSRNSMPPVVPTQK